MSTATQESVLAPPAFWLEHFERGTRIVDADGWADQPFDQPVTLEEFQRRLAKCTVMFEAVELNHRTLFNFNSYVRLKLTPAGVRIALLANRKIHAMLEQSTRRPQNYEPHYRVSSSGYLTIQLWEAMELFGQSMRVAPFEATIELIPGATS